MLQCNKIIITKIGGKLIFLDKINLLFRPEKNNKIYYELISIYIYKFILYY